MALPSRTSTKGIPYSAFQMLRLATSRVTTITVPAWPSPELSTGHSCTSFGKHKCWEVKGPALLASKELLKDVKGLLDSRAEYLHDREPKTCFISFGVYMVGKDESKTNPTLVISCERKPPRQKAVKLIRESTILNNLSGFRLADSSRLPLCPSLPVSLGPPGKNSPQRGVTGLMTTVVYSLMDDESCGISLFTKLNSDDGAYYQLATAGGFVSIQNTIYGLSTVHSFVESSEDRAELSEESESESAFSFDDELEGESDDDGQINTENSIQAKDLFSEQTVPSESYQPRLVWDNDMIEFGHVFSSSLYGDAIGRDWILVEATLPLPANLNQLTVDGFHQGLHKRRVVKIENIVIQGPVDREIWITSGMSGIVSGSLSSSPIFLKMPGSQSFEELWTVRSAEALLKGDSGSWVVDSETGDLYGHVVLGHPGFGIAYIMPAKHIAQDIQSRFGSPMTLASLDSTMLSSRKDSAFNSPVLHEFRSGEKEDYLGPGVVPFDLSTKSTHRPLGYVPPSSYYPEFSKDSADHSSRMGPASKTVAEILRQRWMHDNPEETNISLEPTRKTTLAQAADGPVEHNPLFGLTTNYEEDIYTIYPVPIDKNHLQYKRRMADADKKAREIELETSKKEQ